MTSWHWNPQRISNAELWRFLLCYRNQAVEQTVYSLVICDATTLMRYHCNVAENRILISVKVINDMICINHRVKEYNLNANWTNRLVLIRNDLRTSVSQNLYCWTSIPQVYPSLWEHFQSKASVSQLNNGLWKSWVWHETQFILECAASSVSRLYWTTWMQMLHYSQPLNLI